MTDTIVEAAQSAFANRLKGSSDVADNTKNAQAIAKIWRSAVRQLDPDRFQIEVIVAPELDQRIDIVDLEKGCAYEFKVSGKNASAEFYKDIVKVIIWNERNKNQLFSLVFITEEKSGRPFLSSPMILAYISHLAEMGIEVRVEYVRHV